MEKKTNNIISQRVRGILLFPPAVTPLTAIFSGGMALPGVWRKKQELKDISTVLLTFVFMALGIFVYWCVLGANSGGNRKNTGTFKKQAEGMLDSCCGVLEEITGYSGTETKKYIMEESGKYNRGFSFCAYAGKYGEILGMAKLGIFFISGLVVNYISASFIMGDMENIQKKIREYSWLTGI